MCNLGKIDRIIRALLGLGLITAAYFTYGWLAIIGAVAVGTSIISFCPLYKVLGINTGCKTAEEESPNEE